MDDLISRKAAIDAVHRNYDTILDFKSDGRTVADSFEDIINALPSAQPEIKPIDYQDCANAMMRMWMDNVVTDGEYNRIMDKLNAFWRTRNERFDRQTGGD